MTYELKHFSFPKILVLCSLFDSCKHSTNSTADLSDMKCIPCILLFRAQRTCDFPWPRFKLRSHISVQHVVNVPHASHTSH